MDIFAIDLTIQEINFIRQCLDLPSISGKDAKFLAGLQYKLEQELAQIEQMKLEEEQKKRRDLEELVAVDQKNTKAK